LIELWLDGITEETEEDNTEEGKDELGTVEVLVIKLALEDKLLKLDKLDELMIALTEEETKFWELEELEFIFELELGLLLDELLLFRTELELAGLKEFWAEDILEVKIDDGNAEDDTAELEARIELELFELGLADDEDWLTTVQFGLFGLGIQASSGAESAESLVPSPSLSRQSKLELIILITAGIFGFVDCEKKY
jgi:hypothetical protein